MASSSPSSVSAGLTFSLDVSSEGAASLRNTVMEKLPDFMGSYTDDVLAEYVVVLVGHGKHQAQAAKDLEAFLGDKSAAFVAWLWDHLGTSMHLYTSNSKALSPHSSGDVKLSKEDQSEKFGVNVENPDAELEEKTTEMVPLVSSQRGRIIRLRKESSKDDSAEGTKERNFRGSSSRREEARLSSGEKLNNVRTPTDGARRSTRGAKRSRSPDLVSSSKRSANEKGHLSPPRVSATRRLLQSAVRQAVAPSTSGGSKRFDLRLRSVLSAEIDNSKNAAVDRPFEDRRITRVGAIRQSKRAIPAVLMAIKAAAAAAEDATKARRKLAVDIWGRLGKQAANEDASSEEEMVQGCYTRYDGHMHVDESRYVGTGHPFSEERETEEKSESEHDQISEVSMAGTGRDTVSDLLNDEHARHSNGRSLYPISGKYAVDERADEGYEEDHLVTPNDRLDRRGESVTVEYRVAQNTDRNNKEPQPKQKGVNASTGSTNPSSQKIVNISVNVNTWKPHETYNKVNDVPMQEPQDVSTTTCSMMDAQEANEPPDKNIATDQSRRDTDATKHAAVATNQKREGHLDTNNKLSEALKEVPKAALPPSTPGGKQLRKSQDDAVARTVFVTNIHFAATKELVAAHFAPCGEISRIVMLTDGATGQPKGSAYIEFKTKDAADRGLAMNESSFFSRILKVVRKEEAIHAIQETNPLIRPGLIRRPIPLSIRRPLRGRYLRGSPYVVHSFSSMLRPPYGSYPSSLQWKREGGTNTSTNSALPHTIKPGLPTVRPGRSLSYIRSASTPSVPPTNQAKIEEKSTPELQQRENQTGLSRALKQDQTGDIKMELVS